MTEMSHSDIGSLLLCTLTVDQFDAVLKQALDNAKNGKVSTDYIGAEHVAIAQLTELLQRNYHSA